MDAKFCLLLCFIIPVVDANSVDPDQMLCYVTSDLGLHCLLNNPFGGLQIKLGW